MDLKKDVMIPCIIMAGGRSSRFDFNKLNQNVNEKPLITIDNQKLIDIIIKEVRNCSNISNIYIAISKHTPQTENYLTNHLSSEIKIIETPGVNYHEDLKYVIKKHKFEKILILTSDNPSISSKFLDEFIMAYFLQKKTAYSAMISTVNFKGKDKNEINNTELYLDEFGNRYVVLGINIIDGNKIDEKYMEQGIFNTNNLALLNNINNYSQYCKYLQLLKR